MAKERLFSYSYMGEEGSVHKLSFLEQIRLLTRQLFKNEKTQNEVEESLLAYEMELRADTIQFLERALEPLAQGLHKTVRIELASRYIDVLDYIIGLPMFDRYYTFEYKIPSNEYGLDYMLIINISVKEVQDA